MANIPGIFPKFLPNLTYTDPNITYLIIQGENDPYPGKIPIGNITTGSGNAGINGTTWQLTIGDPNGTLEAKNIGDLALLSESGFVYRADANGTMNWQNQGFTLKGENAPPILASNFALTPFILNQLWIDGSEWPVPVKIALQGGIGLEWNYTGVELRGANGGLGNLTWGDIQPLVFSEVLINSGSPPSGGNVSNYPALFLSTSTTDVFVGEEDSSIPGRTGNFTLLGRLFPTPFTVPEIDSAIDYITQSLLTDTAGQLWIANTSPGVGVVSPLSSNTDFNRIATISQFTNKIDPPIVLDVSDITLDPDIGGYTNLRDLLQFLYDNI